MSQHNRCYKRNAADQHLFIISAAQCPTLTPPGNGTLSPIKANYSYNDEVTFSCNQGYKLDGASSARCQADRTWSNPVPTCTRNHAFEVLRTANQQYNGVDFLVINARLPANGLSNTSDWCRDYQNLCAEYGLRPTGCREEGEGQGGNSPDPPDTVRCVTEYNSDPYIKNALGCGSAKRVAEVANLAFSAGASFRRCFSFYGCQTSWCQRGIHESHWSLHLTEEAFGSDGSGDRIVYTVCAGSAAVQCPTLTPPDGGELSPIGANSYNDEVTFTCNQGYRLEGASSVRCQANRTWSWSDSVPTCTDVDACLTSPCDAQATCTDNPPPALDANCTCNTGYTGDGLGTGTGCADIDACLANPCDAQATCTDNPPPALDATCTCNTGYTGDGLSTGTGCADIDACLANPCDAQATCTDNPPPALDATCTCNTGYTGDGLGTGTGCADIDACLVNPCDAQATCTDNPPPALDATCTCNTGYTGDGLGTGTGCADIDACLANPCDANATCMDRPPPALDATCTCNTGYTGDGLGTGTGCADIDACLANPCDAQAICTDNPPPALDATCTCNTGYTGDGLGTGTGCAECGHCLGGDVNCDPVSGICSAGCLDGWKTQHCKETVEPPMNLNVTDITDEGFKVTWSPSPDPDLQAYRVVVSELDMTTSVNQTTGETWLQVVRLTSETDYIIRVTVLVLSDGRWSQSNATTTEATTIMSSSTDLEFVNVTETTSKLRVTWVPPDAVVTGYRIMYGQEEATEQLNPSPGPGERSALLEGLQPDTMYKVEIITIGVGQESLPLIGQNATEPDECATVNGRCDHICSNVPGGYRCQCHQGFVLMADAHGCGVCGQCQGGDVNCDPMSGVCSAGCQDGWKTQLCDKAVDPPMDLAVTDITDEGFKVTWAPSPDPDLEGYRVVVSKLDMTTVNKTSDKASFPVVGLSPETDYIIRVTALFSSGGWRSQSEATMIVAATGSTPTTIPAPAATTTMPAPAATTTQTRRRTTLLSTEPATLTVSVGGEESSDEAAATTEQTSKMTTVQSTRPSTPTVQLDFGGDGGSTSVYHPVTKTISEQPGDDTQGTKLTSSRPPVGNRATPDQNADVSGDAAVLGQPTSSAAEEKAQVSHVCSL
ncbi:fibrillin-1-like isoform X2 [Branchiostoma lanceolatum]|uniref:fibrillin-1-like isoform X2 n=1 Tax=Branchiostoma lanceolatum TaxID=7740 RepID=UPI003454E1F6